MDPCENQEMNERSTESKEEVTKICEKKFHRMLKQKPSSSFQVIQVVTKRPPKNSASEKLKYSRLNQVMDKFKSDLRSYLPDAMPLK